MMKAVKIALMEELKKANDTQIKSKILEIISLVDELEDMM